MLTHFPHYAKANLESASQDSIRTELPDDVEDVNLNKTDNEPFDIPMIEQNIWNEDMFRIQKSDPDRAFVDELYNNLKELDDEAKSLFKIRSQALMHSLKYKKRVQ